jgi:hypothetical protein
MKKIILALAAAGMLGACAGPEHARIPVDSSLKQWQPTVQDDQAPTDQQPPAQTQPDPKGALKSHTAPLIQVARNR